MGRYDDIFVEGIATFQQPKNKKKQAEIAKSLNKSVKSIDNTLQRIKSKLK